MVEDFEMLVRYKLARLRVGVSRTMVC